MKPEPFRLQKKGVNNYLAHLMLSFAVLISSSATPAFGAPFEFSNIIEAAPLASIIGALGFGLIAGILVRHSRKNAKINAIKADKQITSLHAKLDNYESLLQSLPEILIIWQGENEKPIIYGQSDIIFSDGRPIENVTKFNSWLRKEDSDFLLSHIDALKNKAMGFEIDLTDLNAQNIRISGHILAGNSAIRIRSISQGSNVTSLSSLDTEQFADFASTKSILGLLSKPAWICNKDGKLIYANASYLKYASKQTNQNIVNGFAQIIPDKILEQQIQKIETKQSTKTQIILEDGDELILTIFKIEGGSAGFLRILNEHQAKENNTNIDGYEYVDAFSLPVAVFDNNQKLCHFNKAYSDLWGLDKDWLNSGVSEQAILDKLHTKSLLPSEVDYRKWRNSHLTSYQLKTERINEWYLPDGRIISVKAVPASKQKGVVYIFEDISESRALKIRHNALVNVQSETLNALSEGVAVFGTNARLTLSNPRLCALWGLPLNELEKDIHIDEIGNLCAKSMPQDGKRIWNELKQAIIDLNPTRTDKSERIKRADGRLIDYSITRLPDGQSLLTFVDVTKSATYETILKERNDALIVADRLKDDFVKNVSYELRSPLTNIIGFAEMLDSGVSGELNEKQIEYTNYIKTSSQRLGILIDNILDLATADAGVLELNFEELDISQLIKRAKAGLVGILGAKGSDAEIDLEVNIAANLPVFVADSTRIVQILYNLLSNAVRFSDKGSKIWLNVTGRQDRVIFTIEDEGVGISNEMKDIIFNRFEGKSTNGQQRGSGLGLAIVKTFVNLHGGTISLEKREPKGTRVIVSMPANTKLATGSA